MKVEKGIKPPKETRGRKIKHEFPFEKMGVGDSFSITKAERSIVYGSVLIYNKKHNTNIQIQTAKEGEDKYRCWRVE